MPSPFGGMRQTSPPWHIAMPSGGGVHSINATEDSCACARRLAISSDIESKLEVFERRILAIARNDEVCRRLMTVQSIGPYIATAIAATVGDPRNFASGRHFAAWPGLTPKQHSTGGKEKLGGISKRGDSYIRRLLIHGARATVARVRSGQMKNAWLSGLLSRRHFNVAAVALANKTARVAWAVMSTEQAYLSAA